VLLLLLAAAAGVLAAPSDYRPVVLWHGLGDFCANPISMVQIEDLIKQTLPGVDLHCLQIGLTPEDDMVNGFFLNVNTQLEIAHRYLMNQSAIVANGMNVVGFSQGGLFMRAYAQRYAEPVVHNLVSVGGPQQGVYGFPQCPGANVTLCNMVRELLDVGIYDSLVQNNVVPAEYWVDPFNWDEFLNYSVFLNDVNNAGPQKNQTYVDNLLRVNNFTLVMFLNDTVIQPKESEHFGFYILGQDQKFQAMEDTPLYYDDWIGIKQLNEQGRLQFLSTIGQHLQFTDEWFIQNIIDPYLADDVNSPASRAWLARARLVVG